MNTPNPKPNQKKTEGIKVNLSSESAERISQWTKQIIGDQRGVNIKPSEVVNWFLSKQNDLLTASEINQYREKNIDQVEVAQWALKEIKAAVRRGERLYLKDLVSGDSKSQCPIGESEVFSG